ncbi:MAG TPA: SOS response-associated peptidase [Galbitalea sp.]|jgi:putative SOS response-associated peptidase YedK
MCGRFVLDRKTSDLVTLFDVDIEGNMLPEPSWNLAPTQRIAVVIDSLPRATSEDDFPEPVRRLEGARFGLVPSWAKEIQGAPLFNARSEDVASKPSFQTSVEHRRAVIPATGYYEWRVVDGVKTPHFISLPGEELLLFAGLYEWWRNPAAPEGSPDRWLLSTTILTRPSAGELSSLHERMPVFLDADLVEEWLDPAGEGSQELVDEVAGSAEFVASRAVFHEVSPLVGSVQNNGPELMASLA